MRNAVIGLDVGTTFTKAVVYTGKLDVLSQAHARTPWTATSTGAEVDPTRLAEACQDCLARALEIAGVRHVAAIGVTSFGESGVLVDANDAPVAPVVAWHDRRGRNQAARLTRDLPHFPIVTGRRADERPSVVKWRWLGDQQRIARPPVRWYAIAEWVVRSLGGTPASDASLASRTGAIDVVACAPYDDAIAWSGLRDLQFGELAAAGTPAGTATNGPAAISGAVLTVAGLDCYASARAVGVDSAATALLSCGTSGAAVRVLDRWPDPEAMRQAIELDFTVDRFLDAIRPVALGATPCGLILQPLIDVLGPPSHGVNLPGDPDGDHSSDELWLRAFDAVADGEARLIRDLRALAPGLANVVAVGGWIAQPRLRSALERRLGELIAYTDATTAADGAARLALQALDAPSAVAT